MVGKFPEIAFLRLITILIFVVTFNHDAAAVVSCVRGFVLDPNGAPVDNCDLDFDNAITGERLYTPGDNTDPTGFYTICVPNGTYNISYGPPPGTHLLGYQIFNRVLSGNVQIDVTLDFGMVISGTATDSATGSPIGRVNINVDDLATGRRIYTPNDKSDTLTGNYWVVVPSGDYRLRYKSSPGSRWRSIQMEPVPVFADTIINVVLAEGMLLSGYVTDNQARGLADIAIDLRAIPSGEKIFLGNDKSDTLGFYNIPVPTGLFQLRYVPPPGSRYVGVAVDSVIINADLARDQILETGWLISSFVHDSTGNPIEAADLDIIQISTGKKLFTANDKTDSMGLTTIALLSDLYTIRVQPPPGSIYDRLVLDSVNISADTAFDFILPEVPKINLTGRVINGSGQGLADIELNFADTLDGSRIFVADNLTDSAGYYHFLTPIGSFHAEVAPLRGSHYAGTALGVVTFSQDTTWSDIILDDGFIFSALVLDPLGQPVQNVDFDFISEGTGLTVFTPHDNTDIAGTADVTVAPGVYAIQLAPPSGSLYESQLLAGFAIAANTSVTIFLAESGGTPPADFILKRNFPNPFNEGTSISYILFVETPVSINIFNILGQRVAVIDRGLQSPGYYLATWDAKDSRGKAAASGLYYYRLKTSKGYDTRSMLLVR